MNDGLERFARDFTAGTVLFEEGQPGQDMYVVLQGQVETRYGPGLRESVVCRAGDFLFIAPDVPHQPINLSDSEPAMAIVARNDPNEQESVELYDPASE